MTEKNAITLENLSKTYRIYTKPVDRIRQSLWRGKRCYFKEFTALKPLNLSVKKGEVVGIVGRNGSGKSTLLQMICGTLTPSTGHVNVNGRISALLELGAGFNPEFTGKENIYLNAMILGMSRDEIDHHYAAILEFAAIGDHINQPVKTYSSGMYVRLAFSVAVATQPDILVVDEALAVGDERFQRKCFARIRQMQERGATILFVSHSANRVTELCDRAILLDQGDKLLDDIPKHVIGQYHKLIFADASTQEAIRNDIRAFSSTLSPDQASESSQFAKDMTPLTTTILNKDGVRIESYRLTDQNNEEINQLAMHQRCHLHFTVIFDKTYHNVRFNYRIRDLKGIVLAGNNSHALDEELQNVQAGIAYTICMVMDCPFTPGSYYIQLGCSAHIDGIKMPLQRIDDALMFKVIPGDNSFAAGYVDIHQEISLDIT